jgi:SAM-dependent methyltransferase
MKPNQEYWDRYNIKYEDNWKGQARQALSQRELSFIDKYLPLRNLRSVLDIGVGTGRILEYYLSVLPPTVKLSGIDIADQMVQICKDKFRNNNQIKELKVCNLSEQENCLNDTYDLISAIRVLKYNKDWQHIINITTALLNSGGIFVFTMPNKNSLSRFANYGTPIHLTTVKDLRHFFQNPHYEILEIRSFSKLPHFLYVNANSRIGSGILILTEKALEILLGKVFLGKIFFIAVKRR